jgi:acetate kinase
VRRILTINSGSSSLKFALYEVAHTERVILAGTLDRIGKPDGAFYAADAAGQPLIERQLSLPDHDAALETLFAWLRDDAPDRPPDAVGHRIVHGGADHTRPEPVTPDLIAALRRLVPLAPEHLPHELRALEAATRAYPRAQHVVCFDTAFHRHMPAVAQAYALPRSPATEGIIRYGFHGLSYEYILGELARVAGAEITQGRVIVAHLGNGASMAAIHHGRSVDTSMGFTPTGGLVMSTRAGDLDPGVPLYLIEAQGLSAAEVRRLVSHEAGLLGVSGTSADVRDLLRQEERDPRARAALALFCYQARKFVGALATTFGGLETLIFTAGIGEHAPPIRARICAGLEFLGIQLDPARNEANAAVISRADSPVTVRVMRTNEELMIARHTAAVARQVSA